MFVLGLVLPQQFVLDCSRLWDLCPVELGEVRGLIRLRRARYSQEGLKAFYRRPLKIVDDCGLLDKSIDLL